MNFENELNKKIEQIEQIINSFLPEEKGYIKTVVSAMNYSILSGGKRLRPLFMREIFEMFDGKGREIENFMAAIEMIHTYSLIHDDLPAMDNDEYRRGRKTTHVVYGEAMGILAGDGLLNYAFETASSAFDFTDRPDVVGMALSFLGKKSGIYGMLGGQCADIEAEGKQITEDELKFIHLNKTAALLEASFGIGAVLAGASEEEIEIVLESARNVGLAFQIQDDILDVVSTTQELGKPVGSDEKNNKTTYVNIVGLEQAKHEVEVLSKKAQESLKTIGKENTFLLDLIDSLINRKK